MRCRILRALLVGTALLAGGPIAPAAARELRAADNQTHDYPTVQALDQLGALLEHRTNGRYTLKVFHSRQLGEENDTLEQTRLGAIDINRVNVTPLADFSPEAKVLALPFLFRSTEHLNRVLDGPIGQEILDSFEPFGFIGLAFYDSGARSFYNSVRPIRTPADLKGLRIRIQPSESMQALFRALGGLHVPIPYGQVATALNTGLIEGAENNWPSYVASGHHQVAKYYTPTQHVMSPEVLIVSKRLWDALAPPDRVILRDAAQETRQAMRERWRLWDERARERAGREGVIVTSDFDRDAFVAAVQPLHVRVAEDPRLRRLIERIREVP